MAQLLKKGTPVRTASVTGVVKGMKVSDDGETLHYLVAYREHGLDGTPAGDPIERYFLPEEIVVDFEALEAAIKAAAVTAEQSAAAKGEQA
ncbi:MAG TPA: hypothetical protein VE008_07280 [Burkholderiales bacterium]|nr:hypothetical protein [Burkholderiales bacterium]